MASVSINSPKTPVTKGSEGTAAATLPNVCKMPGPPAPFVPTPLPNIGKSGDSPKGYSRKVKIEGYPVAISGATFGSVGDMASKGTGGGIISNNTHGRTSFIAPGSLNVKIEGKNVHLLGDQMLNNGAPSGSPANAATMGGIVQGSCAPSVEEPFELKAELVSVSFKSGLRVTCRGTTIAPPHWEVGKEGEITDDWKEMAETLCLPSEPYSKRAAVFLIKGAAGATYDVDVKVRVTKSKNVSGDGKLVGSLGGLTIEGVCPTGAGEHTVSATIKEPPEEIQSYRGMMAWGIEVESAPISLSLGSALVEVYFVLAKPGDRPYPDGVWSEVLRFLCGKVGVAGEKNPDAAAAAVTTYCHSKHGLRYDTDNGASKYGVGPHGGPLRLLGYLKRDRASCNCYDQAAAVQALSQALGVSVGWRYLSPFGYINPTNLVGVGQCNNPFFGADDTKKLVPAESPDRTAFGNHAFADVSGGNVLDGCAGPHTGSETPQQYVTASIDATPSLYARYGGRFSAGTADRIVPGFGVVGARYA